MKTLWMVMAGLGGVIAAVFVFRGGYENAFVAAAAGAVCWILSYRWQLRQSLDREEHDREDEDEDASS